jgi:hypothetical protein
MSMEFAKTALGSIGAFVYGKMNKISNTVDVVSHVNGKTYRVLASGDVQFAADTLAFLEKRAKEFLEKALYMFPSDEGVRRIKERWTGTIGEIDGSDSIAYSIDKENVYMCIRDPKGSFENQDDLLFVLLHELSHIENTNYGHDDDFWRNFKKTLEIANKLGYLHFKNYDRKNVMICGKKVTSNPVTCVFENRCASELHN